MPKQEYVQIFKRRRVGKTDYRKRRGVIQSKKPLLTFRISNKYVYGQVIKTAPKGDITLCSTSSRTLAKQYDWKGYSKNIPSAYLTGYLLGKEAKARKVTEAIVYSGLSRFVHGSRIAAFLSGAKDAGLELEFDEEILPDENRVKGTHIAEYAKKLGSENEAKSKHLFTKIAAKGLNPEEYPNHFESVRSALQSEKKE